MVPLVVSTSPLYTCTCVCGVCAVCVCVCVCMYMCMCVCCVYVIVCVGGGGGVDVFVHGCDWRERAWRVCTMSVYHSRQEYITWEYKYRADQ